MRYIETDTTKKISKIGLGTHQFGTRDWGYGERYSVREADAIVTRAVELGVTLFDTAEIYGFEVGRLVRRALVQGVAFRDVATTHGFGRSEQILGQALHDKRESVFLATKFYPTVPAVPVPEQHAVASVNRLGARYIDLYQLHQPHRMAPRARVLCGLRALRQAGLVHEVGVSNTSLERWRATEQALGSRVLSNQIGYSLVTRSAERDLLPYAESHGRVVIAHSPLEQGLLSGKYHRGNRPTDTMRATHPLFLPENLDRAGSLIGTLREVAAAHSATLAQIALAWVIRHPVVAAIPGASSVEQLESNVAAADIELTDEEYHALRVASAGFHPVPGPGLISRQVRAFFRAWPRRIAARALA
jgi:aryl-alcohol dehydrogenase-like predicted oxidoreductase